VSLFFGRGYKGRIVNKFFSSLVFWFSQLEKKTKEREHSNDIEKVIQEIGR
jgi:hypothetical protein